MKEITMSIHQFMELERGNTNLKEIKKTNNMITLSITTMAASYITTLLVLYSLGLLATTAATKAPNLTMKVLKYLF